MNNSARRALDLALATEARGMYAGLLSAEEKERIAGAGSEQEFLAQLSRSEAWRSVPPALQSGEMSAERFSDAVERCVWADFEKLYRFANDMSRRFLAFVTLDNELRVIMRALRRLAYPPEKEREEPERLAGALRGLPGRDIERISRAKNFEQLLSAVSGSIYAKPLAALELDEKTGLPALSGALVALEAQFYDALREYMKTGYRGPARAALTSAVEFRADMLNISYTMRMRRFNTPADRALEKLLPVRGSVTAAVERRALEAGSDGEAWAILRATRAGKHLPAELSGPPEAMLRAAQNAYFRKLLHGELNLAVVYAFLTLKESEGDMLRRVYTALSYGLDPAQFMDFDMDD